MSTLTNKRAPRPAPMTSDTDFHPEYMAWLHAANAERRLVGVPELAPNQQKAMEGWSAGLTFASLAELPPETNFDRWRRVTNQKLQAAGRRMMTPSEEETYFGAGLTSDQTLHAVATEGPPAAEAPREASIDATLAERGARYGRFFDHAAIAQDLQDTMRDAHGWNKLAPDQKQALSVIADKIARMLNGDPDYLDNWHDIIGYAKLVEDRLIKEQQPT